AVRDAGALASAEAGREAARLDSGARPGPHVLDRDRPVPGRRALRLRPLPGDRAHADRLSTRGGRRARRRAVRRMPAGCVQRTAPPTPGTVWGRAPGMREAKVTLLSGECAVRRRPAGPVPSRRPSVSPPGHGDDLGAGHVRIVVVGLVGVLLGLVEVPALLEDLGEPAQGAHVVVLVRRALEPAYGAVHIA